jgi:hypothetical protein
MIDTLTQSFTNRTTHRLLAVLLLLAFAYILLTPVIAEGYAGLGGYISEKLLGGTTASLYLGSGTSGPIVLGRGPAVSTSPVTGAALSGGTTTATLNGNITSLAGFPSAQVRFEWGYDPAMLTNTTTLVTVSATGAYSAAITGYDPGQEVYYQAVAYTDGVVRGAVTHFHASGGGGVSYYILWNILSIVVAMGVVIGGIRLGACGNWIALLLLSAIGIVLIVVIRNVLPTVWGG